MTSIKKERCGEDDMAIYRPVKAFNFLFSDVIIKQMNDVYNKSSWPVIAFFLYSEKLLNTSSIPLEPNDFRRAEFAYNVRDTLRTLSRTELPLILRKEGEVVGNYKYLLSPHGRKIGIAVWNYLAYLTKKYKGESIDEYIDRMNELKETEVPLGDKDIDYEEELLKEDLLNNAQAKNDKVGQSHGE